jgi:hypothetical protein
MLPAEWEDGAVKGEMVKIDIDTEVELYPCLVIGKSGEGSNPANGLDVPVALFDRLNKARAAVDEAERAIMEYVAKRYPRRRDVLSWLRE